MYKLKLTKGLSYHGIVKASIEHPYVETDDQAVAEAAIATGYFELVDNEIAEPSAEASEPEPEEEGKALEDMTVAELETYATYNNISLKSAKTKALKIAKLREELGIEEGQKVTYGSPTMVDLESK